MTPRVRGNLRAALGGALALTFGLPAASAQTGAVAVRGAGHPVVSEVRLSGDEVQTRFVVDLDRKIDLRAFTLADPYRVVVDIPQVVFQLPPRIGDKGRGLVKAFRFGLVMQGGSRLVLDVAKPVRVEKAVVLDPANGQPARLVLDLAATDRDTFMRAIALENRATPTRAARLPAPAETNGDPRPLVVIDPGHGGIDEGTHVGNVTEKEIVLEFGLLLRDRLERTGRYRVVMTRTDDTYVALGDRVDLARARRAALMISIHADYLPRAEGDARGASVYTLSEQASDRDAQRLAELENRADVIAGVDLSREPDDVANILYDLAQRETKTFSVQFARGLVGEMGKTVRLHKKPLRSAGFKVLRAPDVPSVLVELGYVSNRQNLKELTSESWRTTTADAMVRSIDGYFSTRLAGAPAAGQK